MAKPTRRKSAVPSSYTVVVTHHRPPDAEARLRRAARTCLAVVAEANAPGFSVCETDRNSKKTG